MATWQNIRYGWIALASLGVLTGTTIYVVNNQRKQIKPQDIIEIAVGVHERCLATQYREGSSLLFHVPPPEYVREWSDGTSQTNALGWIVDRQMMIELDSKIKDLIPYFIDPATELPLTVSGVWAELNIGDGINQFTRTPAIDGNDATYGEYPWQVYAEDLEERYKVLWRLQWTGENDVFVSNNFVRVLLEEKITGDVFAWFQGGERHYSGGGDITETGAITNDDAQPFASIMLAYQPGATNLGFPPHDWGWYSILSMDGGTNEYGEQIVNYRISWHLSAASSYYAVGISDTNRSHRVKVSILKVPPYFPLFPLKCRERPPDWIETDNIMHWTNTAYEFDLWGACEGGNLITGDALGHRIEDTNDFGWVTIIDVHKSKNEWETSAEIGTATLTTPPVEAYYDYIKNVTNATKRTAVARGWDIADECVQIYYDDGDTYGWPDQQHAITNFYGTNHFFYYCTNKYW